MFSHATYSDESAFPCLIFLRHATIRSVRIHPHERVLPLFSDAVFSHPKINLDWHDFVRQDERYMRPREVNYLLGDASKAKRVLGWEPTVKFDELVDMMVLSDLELAKQEFVGKQFSLVEA